MELDELEQSVKGLNAVLNKFPIGAVSLDDFKPIEEKIQTARESLIRLNARLLMLRAKYKQYTHDASKRINLSEAEIEAILQDVVSHKLINARAIKLCLHSCTILSVLSNKEGDAENQNKLYTYMSKLLTLNDNIIETQKIIEKESQVQLDLKVECQRALFDYKNFLKEQEQIRSERLQESHPEIIQNKNRMEKTLRRINVMKKLIRNFISSCSYLLIEKPTLSEMLEKHREPINIETILKMSSQNNEDFEQ